MSTNTVVVPPKRKPVSKNYGLGIFINATLAAIAYLIGEALATHYLGYPLVGISVGVLVALLSILYFGFSGLTEIPLAHRAIPLSFGTRMDEYELDEGWVWNWPAPIRSIEIVDVREKTLLIPLTEVLTTNDVPISMVLSAQYRAVNLFKYLSVTDWPTPLQQKIDSILRIIVQDLESNHVAQEKKNIPNQILNGFGLEGSITEGVAPYAVEQWGIEVIEINITEIRLPEELEAANTETQVQKALAEKEKQQAINERVEAENVAGLISMYMDKVKGLTAKEAANLVQTERGKIREVVISGSASSLEKAGALAGNIFEASSNSKNQESNPKKKESSSTEPTSDNPGFTGSRRRKQEK